jgi:hypothetical protein
MDDRDNKMFLDASMRNTVFVLSVVASSAPDCCYAAEISVITGISEIDCSVILINLAYDGWIRETEKGFQTIGQKLEQLNSISQKVLDEFMQDYYCFDGSPMPRRRYPSGAWEEL